MPSKMRRSDRAARRRRRARRHGLGRRARRRDARRRQRRRRRDGADRADRRPRRRRARRDRAPRHLRFALELLDAAELPQKLPRVGRPALGLLGEQARHHFAGRDRKIRPDLARIARLRVQDLVDERRDRFARKRASAGQQLVENDAQGEQVRASVDLLAADLLGRHVRGAADHLARPRHVGRGRGGELADAEVGDLHAAVLGDQDVPGLDVAVDDVALVRVGQSLGRLADDRDLGRERRAPRRRGSA